DEDTSVLGMPVTRRQANWLKWAIPIAAVLLIVTLGVAVIGIPRDSNPDKDKIANAEQAKSEKSEAASKDGSTEKPPDPKPLEQHAVAPQAERPVDPKLSEKP